MVDVIILYISSLILIAAAAGGAVWMIHISHTHTIDGLRADNKELRDRLFQSKAMAPSGVDLTEVYEERKLKDREHKEHSGEKLPPGPLERLEAKWKKKDLQAAEQGLDYTEPRRRAN